MVEGISPALVSDAHETSIAADEEALGKDLAALCRSLLMDVLIALRREGYSRRKQQK
jgi:hypothetical protein